MILLLVLKTTTNAFCSSNPEGFASWQGPSGNEVRHHPGGWEDGGQGNAEYVRKACEGSLERLDVD